jgi:16S rRNA U516 pseudouridylate synthase RsuA-like enzyme
MVEALDAKVVSLARIAIGKLTLGGLAEGATRPLTRGEVLECGGSASAF